jgi:four helix bundle protein
MSSSYRDLRVWQDGMRLALEVHKCSNQFPRSELYGLTSQMRRAAVSIPSNIAEGKGRRTDKDFCMFLFHARGSLLELETQLLLAGELGYLEILARDSLLGNCKKVGSALPGLINSLQ